MPEGCHGSSKFIACQVAITIAIAALEGFMHPEFRSVAETLAKHLSLLFCLEVGPERLNVDLAGLRDEEVRAAVPILRVESRSILDLAGHILVIGDERVTKLRIEKSIVAISVKSSHK